MISKKKILSDEVNLGELISTVWESKWSIIIAVVLAISLMFIFLESKKPEKDVFLATTEIRTISIFDEFEYETYNSYLENTYLENVFYSNEKSELILDAKDQETFIYTNVDNSSFSKIDRFTLIDLFIDKFNQRFFYDAIQKFGFVKKENYENYQTYENAIIKLSSSIKLVSSIDNISNKEILNLQFQTGDKETWEKFLNFIVKKANIEIQSYLTDSFNRLILNQKKFIAYKIEDIEIIKSNILENDLKVAQLENLKRNMIENKNIERLEKAFSSTPIVNSNDFSAVNMLVEATKYKKLSGNKYSTMPMLIMAGLAGALIQILFVTLRKSLIGRY